MSNQEKIKVRNKSHNGLSFAGSTTDALFIVERLRSISDIDDQDFLSKFLWALEVELQNQGILDNEFNLIVENNDND